MTAYDILQEYDKYGNPIGKPLDDIKKGDVVKYIKTVNHFEGNKKVSVKTPLYGVWDGEKVQFDDDEHIVVRTIHWLELVEKRH
jgi:hypothetical protein